MYRVNNQDLIIIIRNPDTPTINIEVIIDIEISHF